MSVTRVICEACGVPLCYCECQGATRSSTSFYTPSGIEAAVCKDIAERQKKGFEKYGVSVADNPLPLAAWLQHAYEETLDKAIYLKRAIQEIDKNENPN